jgi:hypothetical protein
MVLGLFRYHHQKDITMTRIIECLYVDGKKKKKKRKKQKKVVFCSLSPFEAKERQGGNII